MTGGLTIVFPYYKNPNTLRYQRDIWVQYPQSVAVVLVDDGSPDGLRAEQAIDFTKHAGRNITIARILTDLPWNVCGARNLGIEIAKTDWVLFTDIDHVVTSDVLNSILSAELDEDSIYSFKRKSRFTGAPTNPHKESLLLTRRKFIETGRFNEAFCGHYALAENEWLRRIKALGINEVELDFKLERIGSDFIPDSKTHGLPRKEGVDAADRDDTYNLIKGWIGNSGTRLSLRLPWKIVSP